MSLDVDTPEPPELGGDVDAGSHDDADADAEDHRREELEEFLEDGAWQDGFEEWADGTDVGEEEWTVVTDLEMLREFDFFWDAFADRVGFHAPGIPQDWKERDIHPALDSWGAVSTINAEMTELGRTVANHLEERVGWSSDFDADFDAEQSDPGE